MEEELLSNEEMAALLPETAADETARDRKKRVVPYNFQRPDRLSKEQVRSLHLLHDMLAHTLSSSLPLFMRAASEVNLISVEPQTYGDYMKGLPQSSTIFSVSIKKLRGVFVIELNNSVALPIVDRMLGGDGLPSTEMRSATDLELNILEGFLKIITDNYQEAWQHIVEFETEVVGRETRPHLVQIVAPNEVVVTAVYQIQIGDAQGLMSFCLPVSLFEPVIEHVSQSTQADIEKPSAEATHSLLKTLSTVRFPVSAEIEKTPVAVSDLMNLGVGDVLRTNHRLDKPVNISVGGLGKFLGRLGSADRKLVVQITQEYVQALSKSAV